MMGAGLNPGAATELWHRNTNLLSPKLREDSSGKFSFVVCGLDVPKAFVMCSMCILLSCNPGVLELNIII